MKKLAGILVSLVASSAMAQWTVVNLHPPGATMSRAFGVRDGKQVGSADVGDIVRASMWSGTAASWVDLRPQGQSGGSEAVGAAGSIQVGHASVGGSGGACLWQGSAGSWLDMHPGGSFSYLVAADTTKQVGVVGFGNDGHAGLWSGSPGSWIDLHPAGAESSQAHGVYSGQQVGDATVGGLTRASLWTGTPNSWVDLSPASSTESAALAVHAGQQGGWATIGVKQCAGIWSGSAASWVNLHPATAAASRIFAVYAGRQAGGVTVGSAEHAALWDGTMRSWRDLHILLPAGFSNSTARGVWVDGALTYVVGRGLRTSTGRDQALMWVSRALAPTAFEMFRGNVFSGNLSSLLVSDNNRLVMTPGVVFSSGEPPIQVVLHGVATAASPNGLSFTLESSGSFNNAQQKILLFNFTSGLYEEMDARLMTTADEVTTVNVTTDAARFIDDGTLEIRAKVTFRALGPAFAYPWMSRIDRAWWTFPG